MGGNRKRKQFADWLEWFKNQLITEINGHQNFYEIGYRFCQNFGEKVMLQNL